MNHVQINRAEGVSSYRLSQAAGGLEFYKPSLRYPARLDTRKKAVLRALCDHYPNVWPGVPEIAKEASCSQAQTRRILRDLEYKDRLIVDINSFLTWQRQGGRWVLNSDNAGKKGGVGSNGSGQEHTTQYFICDRKILDVYHQQKLRHKIERSQSGESNKGTQGKATSNAETPLEAAQGSSQRQSRETEKAIVGEAKAITGALESPQRGSPLIAKQTSQVNSQEEQTIRTDKVIGQKQTAKPKTASFLFSSDRDLTVTSIGSQISTNTDLAELVSQISDGEFDTSKLENYEHAAELHAACESALTNKSAHPFHRKALGDLMAVAMDILNADDIKAPKGWYPVIKILRQGGPCITPVRQPEPKPVYDVLSDPQSALHFYQSELEPVKELIATVDLPVPSSWTAALEWLDAAIDMLGSVAEIAAVREKIQMRISPVELTSVR